MALKIELNKIQSEKIEELAKRSEVTPTDLIKALISDFVSYPEVEVEKKYLRITEQKS